MSITWDDRSARRAVKIIAKQAPYALAQATSGIMYQAQQEIRGELSQHFTVRRKTFLDQSIKVTPMRKDALRGEIGVPPRPNSSIDEALAAQEYGGDRPNPGGGKVAEPLQARPTPTAITPPSKWPGKLKGRFTIKTAGGALLVMQRVGKAVPRSKRSGKRDPGLRVMYALVDRVRVPKNWNFVATVMKVYRRDFPARLQREFLRAIRTAR